MQKRGGRGLPRRDGQERWKPSGYGGKSGKPPNRFGKAPAIRPSKVVLGQLLARYGVHLRPPTLDKLWVYHQLLREHNHDQDLTRLIGFDTIAQRHYADCMILHGLMQGRWPSPLVDVGTGAGFPGSMIKLMSPSTRMVLAEPRPRRVQFLELAIRELGLTDISVFGHKVTSRSLTQPFAATITRAFRNWWKRPAAAFRQLPGLGRQGHLHEGAQGGRGGRRLPERRIQDHPQPCLSDPEYPTRSGPVDPGTDQDDRRERLRLRRGPGTGRGARRSGRGSES